MVNAQVCLSRQICRTTSVEKHRHEREHHALSLVCGSVARVKGGNVFILYFLLG